MEITINISVLEKDEVMDLYTILLQSDSESKINKNAVSDIETYLSNYENLENFKIKTNDNKQSNLQ